MFEHGTDSLTIIHPNDENPMSDKNKDEMRQYLYGGVNVRCQKISVGFVFRVINQTTMYQVFDDTIFVDNMNGQSVNFLSFHRNLCNLYLNTLYKINNRFYNAYSGPKTDFDHSFIGFIIYAVLSCSHVSFSFFCSHYFLLCTTKYGLTSNNRGINHILSLQNSDGQYPLFCWKILEELSIMSFSLILRPISLLVFHPKYLCYHLQMIIQRSSYVLE